MTNDRDDASDDDCESLVGLCACMHASWTGHGRLCVSAYARGDRETPVCARQSCPALPYASPSGCVICIHTGFRDPLAARGQKWVSSVDITAVYTLHRTPSDSPPRTVPEGGQYIESLPAASCDASHAPAGMQSANGRAVTHEPADQICSMCSKMSFCMQREQSGCSGLAASGENNNITGRRKDASKCSIQRKADLKHRGPRGNSSQCKGVTRHKYASSRRHSNIVTHTVDISGL